MSGGPPEGIVPLAFPWVDADAAAKARRAELANRLREVSLALAKTYNATVRRIERDMPDVEPFEVTTVDGAPMLAPTLAALGNVYAAMVALEVAER